MNFKPKARAGYGNQQLDHVLQTCLYMATKLGDLLGEIVVVGGLVPYLLIDQENLPSGLPPHAGTVDLDLGLASSILNEERYRELSARLRDAGFEPDVNDQGIRRLQSWTTGTSQPVNVDFLIPPNNKTLKGSAIHHIESDLAAIVKPVLELAFQDRCWKELSGPFSSGASATRNIQVCGPGAFTVLKALAFDNRTENKDAYDPFYIWSGVGIRNVVESLTSLLPNIHIDNALQVHERDFCNHDGLGPIGTAHFGDQGLDDNLQADVAGYAQAFLRSLGRL